jgi:hypothetical protein
MRQLPVNATSGIQQDRRISCEISNKIVIDSEDMINYVQFQIVFGQKDNNEDSI